MPAADCKQAPDYKPAVRRAGARIVDLVLEDVRPRDVLTPDAFANAVTVMLALSGSINTMKPLKAVAVEAECDVDIWRLYETLAPRVPLVAARSAGGGLACSADHAAPPRAGRLRDPRSGRRATPGRSRGAAGHPAPVGA